MQEGTTLYEEVVKVCGEEGIKNFSTIKFNLKDIRIICLLGEGSFAKVFLVRKETQKRVKDGSNRSCSKYYAMKVLSKNILKEKDYFSYIKLEK